MRLDELTVFITTHALEQYCARVEELRRQELEELVTRQIGSRDFHRSDKFISIAGVWWIHEITDTQLRLVTCYGLSHFDLPAALAWAARHKDRLVLEHEGIPD